jgi:hypothetical protein
MDKLLNPLIDGVTGGNILVVAIIFAVAFIFNVEKIFSFLDGRKKVKIQLIEESLNNSHVNGNTKLYLENLIESEYFKSITGINLEKEIREALLQAHQKTNGELNFKHFKRSIPYLSYKDAVLSVKIDIFSMFGFIYNLVLGLLSVIAGMVLLILPAFTFDITSTKIFSIYGVAVFLVCFGGLMLIDSLPIISAKYVQKMLKKTHNDSMHPIDNESTD